MRISQFILSAVTFAAVGQCQYPNPGACTGVCGNSHDPAIIRRDDGMYFRFSTNGKVAIHTAPALTGPWVYKGSVVKDRSKINQAGNTDLWAPDVTKIGDTYYLYYAVSQFGSQNSALGLATSKTMDVGSWQDRGAIGVSSKAGKDYNAIDANLFRGGNKWYMNFGSFWGDIFQVGMQDPPVKTDGSASRQIVFQPAGEHAIEGVFVFPFNNQYYAFFSAGKCCGLDKNRPPSGQEYRILVCRSSSPTGPYVDKSGKSCVQGGGTVVYPSHGDIYAPGGQGVYNDPQQGPVLYYHYINKKRGYADGDKLFGWNKLDFSGGWPRAL
ncbi:endo-1,5-alpha-L-arabinosidase [Eremomyces bilateralis CBS 781.70]|uniref:Arabinan endo-1,5-alpha-L-arabinosidase n=1 Tax=Eremomyces bilateralis CBS 781.70 TaxID=1392243 RepID=A0A6G1GEP7_9PEZI|nr:endo-1,5-alpha-L-arabinosidase [Eremomyces bilateralis CBS 781.70]KAF1816585.1 endo-1,5-alpha-L-arabinosidase [Eremomyces bilateralis CBS 781.70]